MARAHLCPSCNTHFAADAPEGPCPRCLITPVMAGDSTPAPEVGGNTTGPIDPDPGPSPRPLLPADVEATRPLAQFDRGSDPNASTRTADGEGGCRALPRGAFVRYFGDFEIEQELGRGGMGVVYRARQVSLNRPVALKMVKAGVLANEAELRRFQNEAEAVALLDHPGIVPVYQVGEHEGQKYFSMKLVEGGNLAVGLAPFVADPQASASLMAEAADAIHHAHMRGILHRDLKPANILADAAGHPHVTDFGLAKRVEADFEMTQSGAVLGTPAYMSPEQAAGRRGAITTATDVYGLGAVLYALLAGRAPFGGDSIADTLQAVKERMPEPPSRINGRVPRDLEVICLKCLEKDPARRYRSADALAEDLRRWLDGRPIEARPTGPVRRLAMWCRRHPAPAALTAALALTVTVGSVGSTVLWLRAERNFRNEQAAREDATKRFDLAMESIRTFHTGVSQDVLLRRPELDELRRNLLKQARDFYRKLRIHLAGGAADSRSRLDLAEATMQLARITETTDSKDEAIALAREAVGLLEALAREHPDNAVYRTKLGTSLTYLFIVLRANGRTAEARDALARAQHESREATRLDPNDETARSEFAATTHNLAVEALKAGEVRDARDMFLQALPIYERFLGDQPGDVIRRRDLGVICSNLGEIMDRLRRPEEALAYYQRAVEVQDVPAPAALEPGIDIRNRGELVGSITRLGHFLRERGRLPDALREYERAGSRAKSAVHAYPNSATLRYNLATSLQNLALLRGMMGRPDEAIVDLDEPRVELEGLVREHPTTVLYRRDLAMVHQALGTLLASSGRPAEALESCRRASELLSALALDTPDDRPLRGLHLAQFCNLCRASLAAGRPAEALEALARARDAYGALLGPEPVDHYNLACILAIASVAARIDGPDRSRLLADEAIATLRVAVAAGATDPDAIDRDPDLASLHDRDDFRRLVAELQDRLFPTDPFET